MSVGMCDCVDECVGDCVGDCVHVYRHECVGDNVDEDEFGPVA